MTLQDFCKGLFIKYGQEISSVSGQFKFASMVKWLSTKEVSDYSNLFHLLIEQFMPTSTTPMPLEVHINNMLLAINDTERKIQEATKVKIAMKKELKLLGEGKNGV